MINCVHIYIYIILRLHWNYKLVWNGIINLFFRLTVKDDQITAVSNHNIVSLSIHPCYRRHRHSYSCWYHEHSFLFNVITCARKQVIRKYDTINMVEDTYSNWSANLIVFERGIKKQFSFTAFIIGLFANL